MLLLQAVAERGLLHLWGEVPAATKPAPPQSPYDAGEQLWPALASIISTPVPKPSTATLWLPSAEGQPIASSPLIAPAPPSAPSALAAPQLAPWECTTVPLTPALMVDVLTVAVGKVALGGGVVVGASLAYWVQVLRFAGTLVNRDAYLPGLAEEKGTWRAVWRAVIVGDDARRLATFAKAMPGAARAFGSPTAPPTTAAATVLLEIVNTLVDALVRQNPQRLGAAKESLHEQWLQGLGAADGTLQGPERGWRELATQVAEWARPITETAAAPFRLCFRLDEPTEAKGLWHVRYWLQAHDDPSLLVAAADAWQPHGATADAFRRRRFNAREYLLASLGQAAKVCPPIEASLRQATPGGYTCDVTGAYAFLTEAAWLLEQAGFGVMLPSWWTTTKRRLATSASVKSPLKVKSGLLSLDALVTVEWHVVLGDATISHAELLALAELKSPLVQVRGEWVHVEAAQLEAALAALQKKTKTTLRELVRESLGGGDREQPLAMQGVQATGWVGQFLKQLNEATYEELPPPQAFVGELRPYQVRGFSWLAFLRRWGLGACLADDMGLGKTIQTLALLRHAWETDAKPTLLVCPTSVIGNWQREAAKFVPDFPVHIHHSPTRPQGAAFTRLAKKTGLVLTSYGLLHRDAELLGKVQWGAVVLDEAQNIKNPETKQAKTARSLPADCKIALTGTPVENHVGDLWSIMEFLNPGFLGTHANFCRRFFVPIQAKQDTAAAERLKKLTGPFVLRRLKTDKSVIADLPDKVEMNVYCRLTKEQASLYAATVDHLTRDVSGATGIARQGKVLALLLRLKQLCNHPAQLLADRSPLGTRSGKLNRLREMLEEIHETDGKVLLFSQFTDMGAMLQRFVQEEFGREALYLHGGTSRPQRDEMVKRFQTPDGPRVFVLSLKAGGTGLNLTAANHVMHFDRWWNPAVENQATDRAFRIGQKRSVLVHKFVCLGTVEEKIDAMIEAKKEVAGQVVGTGEKWLTEMSDRDLKNILTLADDAVED